MRTTHTMHPDLGLLSHEDYAIICEFNYQLAQLPSHRQTLRQRLSGVTYYFVSLGGLAIIGAAQML